MTPRAEFAFTVVALLALSTFLFAPVVPYSTSVNFVGPGLNYVNCANLTTTTGGTATVIVTTVTIRGVGTPPPSLTNYVPQRTWPPRPSYRGRAPSPTPC